MEKDKSSILGQNFRKMITILIGLVLIVSGLIITTIPVGAGVRGGSARQDPNNETNDFDPAVTVDTPSNPVGELGYPNDGYVIIQVTVTDDDEARFNITNGKWYWNGTNISAVTIDLTEFGGANNTAMIYDADESNTSGFDNESGEGIWTYNLTLTGFTAGDYNIYFNATDNWGLVDYNASLVIKVSQVNRGPSAIAYTVLTIMEDQYNTDPFDIPLYLGLFNDSDVFEMPANSPADSLSYKLWIIASI